MKRAKYEVISVDDTWIVTVNGVRVDMAFDKTTAIFAARDMCKTGWKTMGQHAELIIKTKKGKIQSKHSYGKDPRKTKG